MQSPGGPLADRPASSRELASQLLCDHLDRAGGRGADAIPS
jgi:hypothetical protein